MNRRESECVVRAWNILMERAQPRLALPKRDRQCLERAWRILWQEYERGIMRRGSRK